MITFLRQRLHRRRIAFAITNVAAAAVSTTLFVFAITAGASPHGATLLRLLLALPILYVGYSRYMLAATLRVDREALGRKSAELRMIGRVGLAIGTAMGMKLAIEPLVVTMLLQSFDPTTAGIAPLIGDFVYGPVVTYMMLRATARSAWNPRLAQSAA